MAKRMTEQRPAGLVEILSVDKDKDLGSWVCRERRDTDRPPAFPADLRATGPPYRKSFLPNEPWYHSGDRCRCAVDHAAERAPRR